MADSCPGLSDSQCEMTQGTGQFQYVSSAPKTNHAIGLCRSTHMLAKAELGIFSNVLVKNMSVLCFSPQNEEQALVL